MLQNLDKRTVKSIYSSIIILGGIVVSGQWTQLWQPGISDEARPMDRAAHAMVILDDNLYVFGGLGSTVLGDDLEFDDTWKFDLMLRKWTNIYKSSNSNYTRPPSGYNYAHALHSNGSVNEMVIFGGLSTIPKSNTVNASILMPISQYNDIWRLKLPSNVNSDSADYKWTKDFTNSSNESASRPTPRTEVGGVVLGDNFYIFGGISYDEFGLANPVDYNELWQYNLSSCTWKKIVINSVSKNSIPQSRFSHSVGLLTAVANDSNTIPTEDNSYLVVVSGRSLSPKSWKMLNDVWLFSFREKKWLQVYSEIPIQRAYTSAITTTSDELHSGGGNLELPSVWLFGGYDKPMGSANGYVFADVIKQEFTITLSNGLELRSEYAYLATSNSTISATMQVFQADSYDSEHSFPSIRYTHRAVKWRDTMVIYGGSYQLARGDIWMFNLSLAQVHARAELDRSDPLLNFEAVVYSFACVVFLIVIVLVVLILKWRIQDQQNFAVARQQGIVRVQGVSRENLDSCKISKYQRSCATLHSIEFSKNIKENQRAGEGMNCESTEVVCVPSEALIAENYNEEEDICPICLVEFEQDEDVRNLPCKHIFHVACIDEWLSKSTACPMCKINVDSEVTALNSGTNQQFNNEANRLTRFSSIISHSFSSRAVVTPMSGRN